jgi:hypothetical protein
MCGTQHATSYTKNKQMPVNTKIFQDMKSQQQRKMEEYKAIKLMGGVCKNHTYLHVATMFSIAMFSNHRQTKRAAK